MKPPGTYKLSYSSRAARDTADPLEFGLGRCQRIVDSLRLQILEGGPEQYLRIRQVFANPREIFRIEICEPDSNYQRTTLLDRDSLEDLLESEEIRERVIIRAEA